jgi:hypothetical protein
MQWNLILSQLEGSAQPYTAPSAPFQVFTGDLSAAKISGYMGMLLPHAEFFLASMYMTASKKRPTVAYRRLSKLIL